MWDRWFEPGQRWAITEGIYFCTRNPEKLTHQVLVHQLSETTTIFTCKEKLFAER